MNTEVRNYLISKVRENTPLPVPYSIICDECNVGIKNPQDPNDKMRLEKMLSEISQFELSNNRPDISQIAAPNNAPNILNPMELNQVVTFWADDTNFNTHQ